jgi:hypothetical protein
VLSKPSIVPPTGSLTGVCVGGDCQRRKFWDAKVWLSKSGRSAEEAIHPPPPLSDFGDTVALGSAVDLTYGIFPLNRSIARVCTKVFDEIHELASHCGAEGAKHADTAC